MVDAARSAEGDSCIVITHGNAVVPLAVMVAVCPCTQKQDPPKHEVICETQVTLQCSQPNTRSLSSG